MLEEGLNFPEIVSKNLLRSNYQSVSSNLHFEANFLVLERDKLVCNEWLFLLKLLNTVTVETNEASEELESVLEVFLLLVQCSITDKSLLICVCYDHRSLFICSV